MPVYALIAMVVTSSAGLWQVTSAQGLVEPARWVMTIYFLLGIGMNLASRTPPPRHAP